MRSANYSHATFPRRRHAPVMEPVSPLHTMFDPPADHRKPVVHNAEPADPDQTPRTAEEAAAQTVVGDRNHFTPTPKKSHDGGLISNGFVYGNMETPMAMPHQHAPIPMGWMPPFPPFPYGPPMSPYGPMTPHGTPGVMYPGYSPGPYYPGMYDMYPMASPPHMMPPPQMLVPAPAPPALVEIPTEEHTDTEPVKEEA